MQAKAKVEPVCSICMIMSMIWVASAAISTSESIECCFIKLNLPGERQSIIYIMHIVDDWGTGNHME